MAKTMNDLSNYDARVAVAKYAASLMDRMGMAWDEALIEALALWHSVSTEEAFGNIAPMSYGLSTTIRDNPERLFKL